MGLRGIHQVLIQDVDVSRQVVIRRLHGIVSLELRRDLALEFIIYLRILRVHRPHHILQHF